MRTLDRTVRSAVPGRSTLHAQAPTRPSAPFRDKQIPHERGFRVFIVPDMEGMGSAVDIHEVIAGNEGERYKDPHQPGLLGPLPPPAHPGGERHDPRRARGRAPRSFVVNEGHGGNLFANVLPWELDSSAILIRGFPKPLIMVTGIDSTFGTLMFTGAHANAGSPGVHGAQLRLRLLHGERQACSTRSGSTR